MVSVSKVNMGKVTVLITIKVTFMICSILQILSYLVLVNNYESCSVRQPLDRVRATGGLITNHSV